MADTIRSTDDFLNASTGLFKDNTAGDISAQDLRDFVLSTYRPQAFCMGRLTLESGVAVSTTDQTAKTSVYFTPYNGNLIGIYDGTSWKLHTFTEMTGALGTLSADTNYDRFIYDNAGTLAFEDVAWTNDTTRATALTTQDGVLVKSGATTRRYLGTFRTTSTTTTEDSVTKRFVWNYNNRVGRSMVKAATSTHVYSTAAWRAWNNDTANALNFVSGEADALLGMIGGQISAATGYVGIQFNGVDPNEDGVAAVGRIGGGRGFVSRLGLNTLLAVQYAGGTVTFDLFILSSTIRT